MMKLRGIILCTLLRAITNITKKMINFGKHNLLSCCVCVFGEIWVGICFKMQLTNVRRCLIYNHENILIFLICLIYHICLLLPGKLETRKEQKPKKFLWLGQTNKPFYPAFVVNWKLPYLALSPPAISPQKCPWTPGYFWHFLKLYMLTLNPPLTLCFELIITNYWCDCSSCHPCFM